MPVTGEESRLVVGRRIFLVFVHVRACISACVRVQCASTGIHVLAFVCMCKSACICVFILQKKKETVTEKTTYAVG